MESTPNQFEVISVLIEQGWVSLRQMAALLGYKELRGIYPRQKGPNAIPVVRIGGISRVYYDEAIEALKTVRPNKQDDAQVLLALLDTATKDHKRKENQNA